MMSFLQELFKPKVYELSAKRNIKGLIKALVHKDNYIRHSAAEALCEVNDAQAVEPLIAFIREGEKHFWGDGFFLWNPLIC